MPIGGKKKKRSSKKSTLAATFKRQHKALADHEAALDAFRRKHSKLMEQYMALLNSSKTALADLKNTATALALEGQQTVLATVGTVRVSATYYHRRAVDAAAVHKMCPKLVSEWAGLYSVKIGEFDKAMSAGAIPAKAKSLVVEIGSTRVDIGREEG